MKYIFSFEFISFYFSILSISTFYVNYIFFFGSVASYIKKEKISYKKILFNISISFILFVLALFLHFEESSILSFVEFIFYLSLIELNFSLVLPIIRYLKKKMV